MKNLLVFFLLLMCIRIIPYGYWWDVENKISGVHEYELDHIEICGQDAIRLMNFMRQEGFPVKSYLDYQYIFRERIEEDANRDDQDR